MSAVNLRVAERCRSESSAQKASALALPTASGDGEAVAERLALVDIKLAHSGCRAQLGVRVQRGVCNLPVVCRIRAACCPERPIACWGGRNGSNNHDAAKPSARGFCRKKSQYAGGGSRSAHTYEKTVSYALLLPNSSVLAGKYRILELIMMLIHQLIHNPSANTLLINQLIHNLFCISSVLPYIANNFANTFTSVDVDGALHWAAHAQLRRWS